MYSLISVCDYARRLHPQFLCQMCTTASELNISVVNIFITLSVLGFLYKRVHYRSQYNIIYFCP